MSDSDTRIVLAAAGFFLFLLWRERHQKFQRLNPVEQALQRASHGFALVTFTAAAIYWMYGWQGARDFVPWLWRDPVHAWPGAVFYGGLLGYGLIRFFFGARAARTNERDGLMATRAFVKLAFGLAITIWLGRLYPWPGVTGFWPSAALLAALSLGAWCSVIGGVRFLLMIGGGGNPLRAVLRQIRRNQTVLGRPPGWRPGLRGLAVAAFVVIGGSAIWFLW